MSYDDRNETPPRPASEVMADIRKFLAERAEEAPLHAAAMDSLFASADPRVASVRRKSSADQLRAVVHCIIDAAIARTTKTGS